jgi:hypothetical protein
LDDVEALTAIQAFDSFYDPVSDGPRSGVVLRDDARYRRLADIVEAGHFGTGLAASDDALSDLATLGRV